MPISPSQCLGALFALLLCVTPALAQPTSSLYDATRDAGASPADAAGLSAAMRAADQEAKLTATDATEGDRFGRSVSLSGDRALVGVANDADNGTDSGSAYVFVRSGTTWTQEAKLSGDRALVGASGGLADGIRSGSAYVFEVPLTVANEATPAGEVTLTAAPNPTASASRVTLSMPTAQTVTVAVFDVTGRRVATLHDGPVAAGTLDLTLDASSLSSGVYLVRAVGETVQLTERITVVR